MGRLVCAVAASAALCVQAISTPAVAASAKPRAVVEGVTDPSLRAAIVSEIGDTERPINNRFEARRRAEDAAQTAIAVLRSEGYYDYDVEPQIGPGDTPVALVKVAPGPRSSIAAPQIEWAGAAPQPAVAAAAVAAMKLTPGAPGRAVDVVSAEGRIVGELQGQGYADAAAQPREVVVDHADHTVQPTFRISAGRLVRLDGVQVVVTGRTDPKWVGRLAGWKPGQVYDPKLVADLQRRLLDTGAYESATVALAPEPQTSPEGLRPVVVSLAERTRRTIDFGASYATTEGFGLDARWTRYNLLGRADTLSLIARVSQLENRFGPTLTLPDWWPGQTLTLTADGYRLTTPAYDQTGFEIRAERQRKFTRTSYLTLGLSGDASRTAELTPGVLTSLGRDLGTFTAFSELALDKSNDPLDPRKGWRAGLRAEPTFIVGDVNLPYVRLLANASSYLPLGQSLDTVLATRVRVGTILSAHSSEVPASHRFYAGGGGSVRGFGYQEVGPRFANNAPQGGVSLLESSFEVRHRLTDHWELATFVDAGNVSNSVFPGFKGMSVGAGAGVRYNLGFGPIRLDIATPVTNRNGGSPIQIYVSLGQSF